MPSRRNCKAAVVMFGGLTTLLVPAAATRALEFQFNPTAGTPQHVIDAFVVAGQRWSAIFDDNVRIHIDIEFTSLGSNSLGETVNYYNDLDWSTVRSRLVSDATSADDALAVQSLPSSGGIPILINRTSNSPHGSGSATPYLDNDGDANNRKLRTPVALQRALGLSGIAANDAIITFNQDFQWDFDPADGIASNRYDFVGIATHELGHALGVLSGVDTIDAATTPLRDDQFNAVTPMDLFRVSDQSRSLGAIDFTADERAKYFSIGDGAADIPLATGVNFGDGSQASHWKDETNSGIFDPSFAKGEWLTISQHDRRLLDVIGYNRAAAWSWAKPVSGDWGRALNWASASNLNDATIGARFDAAGAYTVAIDDVRNASSVEVSAGAVTLQLTGAAAQLRVAQNMSVGPNAALTLTGPSAFAARDVVNHGTFTHAAGATLDVSNTFTNNAGAVTLAGHQVWRPNSALVVNGGTVALHTNATASGPAEVAVTVNGGALNLHESQDFRSFTMTAGAATLTSGEDKRLYTESLSLSPAATLDLTDNAMIIAADASSRDAVLAHVTELIRSARNSSSGMWQGAGITSSAAAQDPRTTLAAIINPGLDHFAGKSVGPDDILIAHALNGDMNIDGLVNADDYFRIDSGFLAGATGFGNGDLNYDGRVNADDYFLIDSTFLGEGSLLSTPAFAVASVSIPEPSMLAIWALTAALAYARVRRSS